MFMTRQHFLEFLSRTPRDWRLSEGKIRRGSMVNPQCPITAVAHLLARGPSIPSAAVIPATRTLHLGPELVKAVVEASDDYEACDPLVRMELMEACGLLVEEERETEGAER